MKLPLRAKLSRTGHQVLQTAGATQPMARGSTGEPMRNPRPSSAQQKTDSRLPRGKQRCRTVSQFPGKAGMRTIRSSIETENGSEKPTVTARARQRLRHLQIPSARPKSDGWRSEKNFFAQSGRESSPFRIFWAAASLGITVWRCPSAACQAASRLISCSRASAAFWPSPARVNRCA